jgi:hypothetical protein
MVELMIGRRRGTGGNERHQRLITISSFKKHNFIVVLKHMNLDRFIRSCLLGSNSSISTSVRSVVHSCYSRQSQYSTWWRIFRSKYHSTSWWWHRDIHAIQSWILNTTHSELSMLQIRCMCHGEVEMFRFFVMK